MQMKNIWQNGLLSKYLSSSVLTPHCTLPNLVLCLVQDDRIDVQDSDVFQNMYLVWGRLNIEKRDNKSFMLLPGSQCPASTATAKQGRLLCTVCRATTKGNRRIGWYQGPRYSLSEKGKKGLHNQKLPESKSAYLNKDEHSGYHLSPVPDQWHDWHRASSWAWICSGFLSLTLALRKKPEDSNHL